MNAFWQKRSMRERALLIIGAAFVLIALWIKALMPFFSYNQNQQQQQQFQQTLKLVQWAEHAKPYLRQLNTLPPSLLNSTQHTQRDWPKTLRELIKGTALGESLTLISQDNQQLQLHFHHAPFDALVSQLHLWQLAGLHVQQFSSTATDDLGYCDVSLRLSLPQGAAHAS